MLPTIDAQAESTLFAALKELKENIATLANKHQLLGQYWGPNDTRAPFEEELTLAQLASFDPQMLIKKKSFTQEKVFALARAIRIGIDKGKLSLVKNPDGVTELPMTTSQLVSSVNTLLQNKDIFGSAALMILGVFTSITLLSPKHDFHGLFENLLNELGEKRFLAAFCADKSLSQKSNDLAVIDQCFAHSLPEIHLHWRTALSGTGASINALLSPYLVSGIAPNQDNVVTPLCMRLLHAMQVQPVKISRKIIPHHFTLNPEVAPKLYKAFKAKKDFSSAQEMSEHLQSAFPFFDFDIFYRAISNK